MTLITAGHVGRKELEELNQYYGTSLQWGEFDVLEAPVFPGMRDNGSAAALRGALFQRFCRKMADQFDVLVSGYNLYDFGWPWIHFLIDDCDWGTELLPIEAQRFIYRDSRLRQIYRACARAMVRPSGRNLFSGDDLIMANSQWTIQCFA